MVILKEELAFDKILKETVDTSNQKKREVVWSDGKSIQIPTEDLFHSQPADIPKIIEDVSIVEQPD